MKRTKMVVSKRALLKRINRWLRREKKQQMYKMRRPYGRIDPREAEMGTYFIVRGSTIIEKKVDLEVFGREHGVLAAYETVGS